MKKQSVKQTGRQAGRGWRSVVSANRLISQFPIPSFTVEIIHHYHYFLSLSYLRASEMTKMDALFPNAALFLHIYHKTEVLEVIRMRLFWLSQDFDLVVCASKFSKYLYYLVFLRLHNKLLNCYMRAAVCIWLVARDLLSPFRFHIKSLLFIER